MGAVFMGQHTLLGRRAAIKVLLPEMSARASVVNRFFNEARIVTSISDPGIVQVFDYGVHESGSAYIVMELLEGETISARLKRIRRIPAMEVLRLGRQIAMSLSAAHAKNIVHRDLKPLNIMVQDDVPIAEGVKILDFGLARKANTTDEPAPDEVWVPLGGGGPGHRLPAATPAPDGAVPAHRPVRRTEHPGRVHPADAGGGRWSGTHGTGRGHGAIRRHGGRTTRGGGRAGGRGGD